MKRGFWHWIGLFVLHGGSVWQVVDLDFEHGVQLVLRAGKHEVKADRQDVERLMEA